MVWHQWTQGLSLLEHLYGFVSRFRLDPFVRSRGACFLLCWNLYVSLNTDFVFHIKTVFSRFDNRLDDVRLWQIWLQSKLEILRAWCFIRYEGTRMYPRGITAPGWCVYAGTVNFIYIKYQALRISYEAGAQISVTAGHILSEKSKPWKRQFPSNKICILEIL